MKQIRINEDTWTKVNLLTLKYGKRTYDLYKHDSGITAKRWGLSDVLSITEHDFKKYSAYTDKYNKNLKGKMISIVNCDAYGSQFANITPNSIHCVIPAPEGNVDDDKGVWVMGVNEPVKILNNEFKYIK